MKRQAWRWGWLVPLAALIAVGLGDSLHGQPASVPAAGLSGAGPSAGLGASAPGGPGPSAGPEASAGLSSRPTTASQPATDEEGEEFPESQPTTSSGPTSGPGASSGPASRSMTAYSRPSGGTGPGSSGYGSGNTGYTRQRGSRTDRNGRSGRTGGDSITPASLPVFGPSTTWNDFSQVATRNIFIKDRSVRPPRDFNSIPYTPMPTGGLILTGIALVEEANNPLNTERVAFFEDSVSGRQVRTSAGQVLDGGRVVAVDLDGIDYDKGGVHKRVGLGQMLNGGRGDLASTPTSAPTETASSGPTTSSAPAGAGGGGADSVLERLKRRRAQELR